MFKIGKLYRCPKHYLMIYPSKEKAVSGSATVPMAVSGPEYRASCLSKRFGCKVRCSEPGEVFMVLEQPEDEYIHVLFGNKQGWIVNKDYLKNKIVKSNAV